MSSVPAPPPWIVVALYRLGAIGDTPDDSEEERLQHRFLLWMGLAMSGGGLLWGTICLAVGFGPACLIPYGYVALTAANMAWYARSRRFDHARWLQVTISLLLPFLFQIVLGGFTASGGVMGWALLALVGSLTFSTVRESLRWLALFLILTVTCGLIDPWVREVFPQTNSAEVQTWLYVLNSAPISTIVFGLTIYVLDIRRRDNLALFSANARISAMADHLGAQVLRAETAEHQALAASRAKSLFLANMSHELRTPLNAVIGYTELLLEENPDQENPELERIRTAGNHLLSMIDDVLDLAKIEAGKMSLECSTVDLRAVVWDVVTTLDPVVRRNGNHVIVELDPALRPFDSDAGKLRQILFNLVGNASKFTSNGSITVSATLSAGAVELRVTDTGVGMTPEQLSRAKDPFEQADPSTTRRFGGTGLGLHLVDQFARLLGGGTRLASEPGRGTTVVVTFPPRCSKTPAASASASAASASV